MMTFLIVLAATRIGSSRKAGLLPLPSPAMAALQPAAAA